MEERIIKKLEKYERREKREREREREAEWDRRKEIIKGEYYL